MEFWLGLNWIFGFLGLDSIFVFRIELDLEFLDCTGILDFFLYWTGILMFLEWTGCLDFLKIGLDWTGFLDFLDWIGFLAFLDWTIFGRFD